MAEIRQIRSLQVSLMNFFFLHNSITLEILSENRNQFLVMRSISMHCKYHHFQSIQNIISLLLLIYLLQNTLLHFTRCDCYHL